MKLTNSFLALASVFLIRSDAEAYESQALWLGMTFQTCQQILRSLGDSEVHRDWEGGVTQGGTDAWRVRCQLDFLHSSDHPARIRDFRAYGERVGEGCDWTEATAELKYCDNDTDACTVIASCVIEGDHTSCSPWAYFSHYVANKPDSSWSYVFDVSAPAGEGHCWKWDTGRVYYVVTPSY